MLTENLKTGGGNIPAFQKMDNSDSKTKGNGKVKTSIAAAVVAEAESFFKPAEQNTENEKPITPKNYFLVRNEKEVEEIGVDGVGVWHISQNKDGEDVQFMICSPLEVVAETQTETGENYGRFLKWKDSKGRVHSYAMPIELIHGETFDLIRFLSARGLDIGTTRKHYEHLRAYINLSKPNKTIISTARIGWNGSAFVLPDRTFGGGSDEIIFQSETSGFHKFNVKGTANDWRENVGKFCAENSRLMFAVSVAFASPLLPIAEITGGGFHFRGTTSTGKTTGLLVGGSVVGGSDEMHGFCQTWKSTGNGLEVIAESHNNLLMCLDEIGECEPREVGNIAYMLANGQGKNRMNRNTARKKSYSWHLLFLSSGERKLSDIMTEAGQLVRGGQEIRLCDIDADAAQGKGMFENLHGFADGRAFSDYLREASRKYYGATIRAFLEKLVSADREKLKTNWNSFQDAFVKAVVPENQKHGEVLRVASRFALVAFAGELATNYGLTGWQSGANKTAAAQVFKVWLDGRNGRGGSDAENILSKIRKFLDNNGQSRFQWLGMTDEPQTEKVINHAGFKRKDNQGNIEFLIFPETFADEVCKGFDSSFAARVLDARGYLEKGNDGKLSKAVKVGTKARRLYVVNSKIFDYDE